MVLAMRIPVQTRNGFALMIDATGRLVQQS
jgi:hypothetical protein